MIFIVVKFPVIDKYVEQWTDIVSDFTEATRREPGNIWFEWSRSVENPDTYVLVEAFEDDGAQAHVQSQHFQDAMIKLRPFLRETPQILSQVIEGKNGWDLMGELTIDEEADR